jgi:hypothetical protein
MDCLLGLVSCSPECIASSWAGALLMGQQGFPFGFSAQCALYQSALQFSLFPNLESVNVYMSSTAVYIDFIRSISRYLLAECIFKRLHFLQVLCAV